MDFLRRLFAASSNSDLVTSQELWQHLPAELVIDILSRLPVGSIFRYKCVCKSWLDLFESREFCRSHLRNSKSIPGLVFFEKFLELSHFYRFVDEHEQDRPLSPERHLSIALKLSLPGHLQSISIQVLCSVNGLLLLSMWHNNYFICNPLTGDYMMIHSCSHYEHVCGIGFGVSKMSGEYKVVRVCIGKCEVYTLGMGSWRRVAPPTYHDNHNTTGVFLNGNLHWLLLHDHENASYSSKVVRISCFDLETELFTIFSPPPPANACAYGFYSCICTLEERLAFSQSGWGIVFIWLMNEYGDHKSWTMKYFFTVQSRVSSFERGVTPIKVLRGGDIMIAELYSSRHLCYFNKTNNTIELFNTSSRDLDNRTIVSYTPSILSLKTILHGH